MKIISAILVLLISTFTFLSCSEDETTTPQSNNPPTTPSNPSPIDQATDVSRSPVLSWTCSDPDAGDSIKYDLFFSSVNPPNTQIASRWIYPNYSIAGLDSNQTYYWRITAKDLKGASSVGPIWSFTTVAGLLTQGLVAYYPFNGNANDQSGNGNNGTVHGATLAIDRFGATNKAYSFDGVSNYIEITDNPVFHSLNRVTLSVWFNANDSTSYWTKLIGKHHDASIGSFYIVWEHNYVRFSAITAFQYGGIASGDLSKNIWHHAAGIYDGTTMSLYVDGILVNTSPNSGIINETSYSLTMGRSERWNEYYHGLIDDIRIYNRALTDSEIQALYHEGGW